MGLRAQAALDLAIFLEDQDEGFGWPITVTDPDGVSATLSGYSTDISEQMDPETGMAVSNRVASVAIQIKALTDAGLGIPKDIPDAASRPWRVTFDDIDGNEHTYKVSEGRPDRAIGLVVCILEAYKS